MYHFMAMNVMTNARRSFSSHCLLVSLARIALRFCVDPLFSEFFNLPNRCGNKTIFKTTHLCAHTSRSVWLVGMVVSKNKEPKKKKKYVQLPTAKCQTTGTIPYHTIPYHTKLYHTIHYHPTTSRSDQLLV
jgi:hypothetical protein